MTRPADLAQPAGIDPIADAARLREMGATAVEIEVTRAGTVRIKAQWPDASAPKGPRMVAE